MTEPTGPERLLMGCPLPAIRRRVAFARLLPGWRDNTPKRDRAELLDYVDRLIGYGEASERRIAALERKARLMDEAIRRG